MKLRSLLALLVVVSFAAVSFAADEAVSPVTTAPATVQANAPADTGTTVTDDGARPHKKRHHKKGKGHKKHGKHHGKKDQTPTTN